MKQCVSMFLFFTVSIAVLFNLAIAQNINIKDGICIGMIADGPWEGNNEIYNVFKKEIIELLKS